jgi:molybdopterin-guanine dinucleotide biosynthesis protein A
MGQDKALLPFLGQPLIQRMIDRVAPLADEIIVIANQKDAFRFLDLPVFSDIIPGVGALGGLHTALTVANFPLVSVVACDMPFVNPVLIQDMYKSLITEGTIDVIQPRSEHGREPFHSVYRKATCLPAVEASLKRGQRRMDSWLYEVTLKEVALEEVAGYKNGPLAFWNINTPKDFKEAEQIAKTLQK